MRARLLFASSMLLAGSTLAAVAPRVARGEPAVVGGPSAAPSSEIDAISARRDAAKARFARGIVLFDAGAWEAALVEFDASIELLPTKSALANAARCLRRLDRDDEALEDEERLLADFGGRLSGDERAAIEDDVAVMRMRVGTVAITCSEADAAIVIDDRIRGTTPLGHALRVRAGTRRVRITKRGFLPFDATLVIAAGATSPIEARLVAEVEPTAIQDVAAAPTPLVRRERLSLALAIEGFAGLSLGSDYEASCANVARCSDRGRPVGGAATLRGEYALTPTLGLGARAGYLGVGAHLQRALPMLGDGSVPVNVDITDRWLLSGPYVALDASAHLDFGALSLGARFGVGALFGRVRDARSGDVLDVVDQVGTSAPAPRALFDAAQASQGIVPLLVGDAIATLPIAPHFRLGISLGVVIGTTTLRPQIQQSVRSNTALDGTNAPSVLSGGQTRPIGGLPEFAFGSDAEAAVGTFVLPKVGIECIVDL